MYDMELPVMAIVNITFFLHNFLVQYQNSSLSIHFGNGMVQKWLIFEIVMNSQYLDQSILLQVWLKQMGKKVFHTERDKFLVQKIYFFENCFSESKKQNNHI